LVDPLSALKGYLVAASLATNFFADMVSVVDIIDQTSLVRLVRASMAALHGLVFHASNARLSCWV